MKSGEVMNDEKSQAADADSEMVRLTISLRPTSYSHVMAMAKRNRVSAAWVIREAVDEYIAKDVPLFRHANATVSPQ